MRSDNMLESYLRQLMAEHKINDISELMDATGVSRNSINKLFREVDMETLKLETLIQICDAFNIRLSDLIQYTPRGFIDHSAIRVEELKRQLSELLESGEQRGAPRSTGRSVGLRKEYIRNSQISDDNEKLKWDFDNDHNDKSDNS
jgi:putative transcriptional regulator